MTTWEERGWQEEDINNLELSMLHGIFELTEAQGVDATMMYARYLDLVGVHPDNYPVFLKILEMKNHWIVDILLNGKDPELFFNQIQPNFYIIRECFRAFARAQRGGIYEKSLQAYLGLLKVTYKQPLEGFRVYPLTQTDVNNLGKHLNEEMDQTYPLNKTILFILDKIASLTDPGKPEDDQDIIGISTQANNIRGKFLDMTKSLNEAIPDELLKVDDYKEKEITPTIQLI